MLNEMIKYIRNDYLTILSEMVSFPNLLFFDTKIIEIKDSLILCKTNKECDIILNEAFNNDWVYFYFTRVKPEDCLNEEWNISEAYTKLFSQSPSKTIVEVYLGKDFCKKLKTIKDDKQWYNFVESFKSVLGHEYIHKDQVLKMSNEKIVEVWGEQKDHADYLSIPQEIMSHAFQSSQEFKAKGLNKKDLLNRLSKPYSTENLADSYIYKVYHYFFPTGSRVLNNFLDFLHIYINKWE